MCDWMITHMPWLVEHVGGMPLAWQTVLTLALVAVSEAGYYAIAAVINSMQQPRRGSRTASRGKSFNWAERWNDLRVYTDREEYDPEWVDYEKFVEAQEFE